MVEKVKNVSNPLTIIAIFAGLAEISGTVVLPLIAQDVQHIFVWFLMLFPLVLVIAFFLTLNRNHRVLYAPSDFRDDESFFRAMTPEEKREKVLKEAKLATEEKETKAPGTVDLLANASALDVNLDSYIRTYASAEDYALRELRSELKEGELLRNVRLTVRKESSELDALLKTLDTWIGVEISLIRSPGISQAVFDQVTTKLGVLNEYAKENAGIAYVGMRLVIVMDFEKDKDGFKNMVIGLASTSIPTVPVTFFDLSVLRKKYEAS